MLARRPLVARVTRRSYAARVSRLQLHRWAVIFLLVSKLIFGELTHAMPHMAEAPSAMDEIPALAGQDSPPCGDHTDSSQDSSTDENCCESGGCACPCLHSPAAAEAVRFGMHRADSDQVAVHVEGAAWHRMSALFRPPA
jgi:hypothetical protein